MTVTLQPTLEALSEIAFTINSIRYPDELMEKVLEIAMETLGAERGFLLLSDSTQPHGFEITNSRNFTEEQLGDLVQLSTSVVHEVQQTGQPVLIYDVPDDVRYREKESIVLQQIQSIACVPLRNKTEPIGAIYLDSITRRSRFTREHLPFLLAVANQAAIAIENTQMSKALRDQNRLLRSELKRAHGFDEIIGQSPQMREVYETMSRVLESDATVLIEGESGTGKELVARAIHYNGHRKDAPFVALFCGSLPENLLESELFGHKKGAFTGAATDKQGLFETADGGTIFLDEVGDLSPALQTALLRVLQEGEVKRVGENKVRKVDVRVISATHRPLNELVKGGEFRHDLLYRLNTIAIIMPPLRLRRADVPLLAHHFLDKYAVRNRSHIKGIRPEAMKALQAHAWPGNVRELQNTIERAVVLARGDWIEAGDLRLPQPESSELLEVGLTLKEVEQRAVQRALHDNGHNISATARSLGVSRRWLHYKLKEWETPES